MPIKTASINASFSIVWLYSKNHVINPISMHRDATAIIAVVLFFIRISIIEVEFRILFVDISTPANPAWLIFFMKNAGVKAKHSNDEKTSANDVLGTCNGLLVKNL